jgi:hypothetical protein
MNIKNNYEIQREIKSRFLKFIKTAGLVAVFAVAGLFLFAGSARAATYYVDVNSGSDSVNITQAQNINTPLKSLSKPFVSGWMRWGDTIKLKSGTYTGGDDTGGIWVSGAGRWIVLSSQMQGSVSDGPLTITIAPGADVTIDMPTQVFSSYMIRAYGNLIIAGESASNKLKITNTQSAAYNLVMFTGTNMEASVTLQDVTIDWNNANSQIGWVNNDVTSYNQNITFRRCEIKNTGTTLSSQAIIRSQISASVFTNLNYESCLLHDVGYLFYQGGGKLNLSLINNTISGGKAARLWDGTLSTSNTFTIKNNIFNGNSTNTELLYAYPFTYAQMQANWTIKNNILYVPTTVNPGSEINKIGYAVNDIVPIDESNYYINPLFTAADDFTLQSGSYASGRGDNSAVPSSGGDLNGTAYRSSSVGCYSNPVDALYPSIIAGTATFVGDSIAGGTALRANATAWPVATVVGYNINDADGSDSAAIGGSGGQATKFYVDRAALAWGPKYIFFVPYHNNYPSSGNTPGNITYAQAANDMEVAMKKAEYWGITPIFVGMSGVMGADPTTKPSSVNAAVATKCDTNDWSCGSFVDYMTTINPSSWNLVTSLGGYYQAGGLVVNVHPASVGYDVALNEAEYLFYSKGTMGTDGIDIGAGAEVYKDGKFRSIGTNSGSTADLTVTPQSDFTAYNYSSWMEITDITWSNTGIHHKTWTETSTTASTNTIHTVGDLEADTYYNVKLDTVLGSDITGDYCTAGVCLSNAQGEITFTYTGTYSSHTFDVEEGDNVAPTAVITYSPNSAVKNGETLIITATFNEVMADSPVPKISISGSNTLAATDMTKTDTTHYYYTHTVGTGDGTATITLSAGTDTTGNGVTSVPTSGATFTVDNTAPTGTTLSLGTITISSITATVSGATDTNADLHATPYYFDRNSATATSDWQAGTIWADSSLTSNTQYTYKVKARDAATNVSIFTDTQSKYTLAPTPINLAADTVGQTAITLTVDAINNPTADSSGYYFANTTNSTNSGWIQTNTWQNTSLTCGTSYNYTIKYRNGDGTETDTIALAKSTNSCNGSIPAWFLQQINKVIQIIKQDDNPNDDNKNKKEPSNQKSEEAQTKNFDLKIEEFKIEAAAIFEADVDDIVSMVGEKRNVDLEIDVVNKYLTEIGAIAESKEEAATSYWQLMILNFITYGTPSTQILGQGERAGAVNSYRQAFGKLPKTEDEWLDVIKISNGRWPGEKNNEAEERARTNFNIVYLRNPDRNNPHDDAAITVMAYGLRPTNRNLNSEKAAIKIFKNIYGYNPEKATAWDVVRAIAYSGAVR